MASCTFRSLFEGGKVGGGGGHHSVSCTNFNTHSFNQISRITKFNINQSKLLPNPLSLKKGAKAKSGGVCWTCWENPETGDRNHRHQRFRQLCKVADISVKAPDVTYFWRHKAAFEHASYLGGSGGMLPQELFKKEHSETLFPAFLETKY